MEDTNWRIDASKIELTEIAPTIADIDTLDRRIEKLYTKTKLPFDTKLIIDYAKNLNTPHIDIRAPWVYKLIELDYSLGPGGYALRFNLEPQSRTYGFFQLLKYDEIYRPMKYVYMPFGLTYCPACWSRDIAENAGAHLEKCVLNLLRVNNLRVREKPTLGWMLHRYPNMFDSETSSLINEVNENVYGKTKHKFDVELPRIQLLSLVESLAVYFVCRQLGLKLLKEAGTLSDVIKEIIRSRTEGGVFIGMDWFIPPESLIAPIPEETE